MNNLISQYSVGDLLDGRCFYIPAYQRGYRWTKKQVEDLLRDLLCFANDPKEESAFYCLQPIIARPITDEDKLSKLFVHNDFEIQSLVKNGVWEIIDGQQRLTTLFLIYKYLLNEKGWDAKKLFEEEDGKQLYKILYATRDDSTKFLEGVGTIEDEEDIANIDYFYMSKAIETIDNWIKKEGKEINQRYKLGGSLSKVRDSLFSLLNGNSDAIDGSVQVLWYQIAENNETNSIKEFQKINTGKIRLTDAELIKGLFLMKNNFDSESKHIKQSQLAIEWEFIENTLHDNSFWCFLQKKGADLPNRIDFLFMLIYKIERIQNSNQDVDKELKDIDKDLQDLSKGVVFRFYNEQFEGKVGDELQEQVSNAWEKIMTLFRTLDDWFSSPRIYNYIGLLSQCGEDLAKVIFHFNKMPETTVRDDFEKYLFKRIKSYLTKVKINEEDPKNILIDTTYKDRKMIYRILLTLNIHLLNEQNTKVDSDIYKFPFDIFASQNWDIEHIDSSNTNSLKSDKDKKEWVDTAYKDLEKELTEEDKEFIKIEIENEAYDLIIGKLKKIAQEEDADEEIKNQIGNLALLDDKTNRSYGNSLFCTKRRIIIERIKQGIFVPLSTQYVFAKFFDMSGTNRSYWTSSDMNEYSKFIYKELKNYLPKTNSSNE